MEAHRHGSAGPGESGWPPEDIAAMLAEMRADENSPHWMRLYNFVLFKARLFGRDHDEIAGEALVALLGPTGLAVFRCERTDAQRRAGIPPRVSFLRFVGVIILRSWQKWLEHNTRHNLAGMVQPLSRKFSEDGEEIGPFATVSAPGPSVEEYVVTREDLEEVVEYLGGISSAHVERFLLAYVEDLSYKDVAERCGCKPGHVRDSIRKVNLKLDEYRKRQNAGPAGANQQDRGGDAAQSAKAPKEAGSPGMGPRRRSNRKSTAGKTSTTNKPAQDGRRGAEVTTPDESGVTSQLAPPPAEMHQLPPYEPDADTYAQTHEPDILEPDVHELDAQQLAAITDSLSQRVTSIRTNAGAEELEPEELEPEVVSVEDERRDG